MAPKTLARGGLEVLGACWVAAAALAGTLPVAPISATGAFGTAVWVVLDGVALAWLVRSVRPALRALADWLTRLRTLSGNLPRTATRNGPNAASISRVILVVAYIAVVQAILRRPLLLALGSVGDTSLEEAWLAVGVLVALALGLARLHMVVHPVVVGTVRGVLDAVLATAETTETQPSLAAAASPALVAANATTIAATTDKSPAPALADATTLAATTIERPTPVVSDATTVSLPADDAQAATTQRSD